MILAGIDIGTNTLRLLIAETGSSTFQELHSGRTITRLGQDLDRTGVLAPDAQERSLRALQAFAAAARAFSVEMTAAVGTSALRNAANAARFIAEAKDRTGIDISVISGDDEARLTLLGVRQALSRGRTRGEDPLGSALIIDIGGGSTELITTSRGDIATKASLPLGAVYLTERHVRSDPPTPECTDSIRATIRSALNAWERDVLGTKGVRLSSLRGCAGTAGTITTLAAMDQALAVYGPDRINGYRLERTAVDRMVGTLSASTLAERRQLAGLEPGREDIILAGAVIAQEIMQRCGMRELLVSDWGLREGIVLDLYEKMQKGGG